MRIIRVFLLRSLLEKKGRTALVLFSIAITAALVFSNEGFSRTAERMFIDAGRRWSANADIIIESGKNAGDEAYIDVALFERYQDSFEYLVPVYRQYGFYVSGAVEDSEYLNVLSVDIQQFNRHNQLTLREGSLQEFGNTNVILGEAFSVKHGLALGDRITMELQGKPVSFTISGISEAKGLFHREEADGYFALISPGRGIQNEHECSANPCANLLFAKLKPEVDADAFQKQLVTLFPQYHISKASNPAVLNAEIANYVTPFKISAVLVLLMSAFIIFTGYNLIALQRIPAIGTLRSAGCSRKVLNRHLLAESAFLGVAGGLVGCIIGLGILLYIKTVYFAGDVGLAEVPLVFGLKEIFTAVCSAVLISSASALIPVLRTTKIPVKDIIIDNVGEKYTNKKLLFIVGVFLILPILIIPRFLPLNFAGMLCACIIVSTACMGLLFIIPVFSRLTAVLLERVPHISHAVILGLKNVSGSAYILNNIRLFALSLALLSFMGTLFKSLSADLKHSYEDIYQYDIALSLLKDDAAVVRQLASMDMVSSLVSEYSLSDLRLSEHDTFLNGLYGIQDERYFDFIQNPFDEQTRAAFQNLDVNDGIIVTKILKTKFDLELGDKLRISGKDFDRTYIIRGFLDSNLGIGHIAYVSASQIRKSGTSYSTTVYLKSSIPADSLKLQLRRVFSGSLLTLRTKAEAEAANRDKVDGIFNSINSYANIALFIGIIGIINNSIASLLQRRRSFALYRCVGMSKRDLSKMLLTESFFTAILGIFLGMGTGLLFTPVIPVMVSLFWGSVSVVPALAQYLAAGGIAAGVMLFAAWISAGKNASLNIIENIKYE